MIKKDELIAGVIIHNGLFSVRRPKSKYIAYELK